MVLILLPILILISIFIFFRMGAPILYRQIRMGKNLNTFTIYKFRSMVNDADKMGSYSTASGDARITPLGQFLRKTSLDELPQVLNVLKGEMSFIGPRPDLPAQKEQYPDEESWVGRHKVRPGITGLSQVRFRSSSTLAERRETDLEYAQNLSFWLDVRILIDTVFVVLKRKNTN
ncbi:MAG: sugar transferase [Bdellovibrionales bacterium]|nr:sugar transferase [Bdellovibrionales bacterium]